MKKNTYIAPEVEVVQLHMENFTMASSLEDYDDNPIFGAPAYQDQMDVFGL